LHTKEVLYLFFLKCPSTAQLIPGKRKRKRAGSNALCLLWRVGDPDQGLGAGPEPLDAIVLGIVSESDLEMNKTETICRTVGSAEGTGPKGQGHRR
jgi:hypothetical protein